MISRVYTKESKRITFSHRITSLKELASIENQNQMELYQTGPWVAGWKLLYMLGLIVV
jgi:hypothetical protein